MPVAATHSIFRSIYQSINQSYESHSSDLVEALCVEAFEIVRQFVQLEEVRAVFFLHLACSHGFCDD